MKKELQPFSSISQIKKGSCQLLEKDCAQNLINHLGILLTNSMLMSTECSQNDPKCVEGSSNLTSNKQIQIACLVLFFIPHNVIHTT